MKYLYLILLICMGCEALPFDHPFKGTYNGYTIKEGSNHCNNRRPLPKEGRTLKFDFTFGSNVIYTPIDSAIHKLYGMSDNSVSHRKNSTRIGWRMRQDSTIDIFAYWYMNSKMDYQWIGNVNASSEHQAELKIREDAYVFRLDENVFKVDGRAKDWLWGVRYRCYPHFEDGKGHGPPHDMTFFIYEY